MAKNISGLKRGFHYDPLQKDLGIYVDGVQVESYTAQAGNTYYVNNITGSSSNNGLSWATPFAQVTTAITAQTAAQAARTSGNNYLRDKILVQGTSTSYNLVATLPSYCDIIGVGAPSYGDGAGIAVIGGAGGHGIAGTARGLRLINLQFQAGGVYTCANFVSLFRSEIAFCTFQARGTDNVAGIAFSAASSGNYIHDCMWTAGGGAACTGIGFDIEGTSFTMNRIENNIIRGVSAGVYVVATCTSAGATVFKDNAIGYSGCSIGVDDNATVGTIQYCGNYIYAGTAATLVHAHTARWTCNYWGITFSTSTNS